MPVTEFAALPFGYQSAWVSSRVLNDFYTKFKPKEWDSVKVLFLNGSAPSPLLSTKPVEKLEDLKGLTIRAPGQIAEIVSALGATPSPTPIVETYDAISKGVSQGAYLAIEGLKTFRLADVCKYLTNSWQVGNTFPFYLIMNKNSYNKIPADLKKIFDKLVGEYAERVALMWNNVDIEGMNYGVEKGVRFIELSDQEALRWKEAVKPLVDKWVKRMVEKGYTESEVKEWISFLKERIEFYGKKQIGLKIPSVTGPAAMRPENIKK
jgi:TRAP-type C4-dicarboxylate transport system substrate-binding protein